MLSPRQSNHAGNAASVENHAFGDHAAPHTRQRQLARMRQVVGLEYLGQGLSLSGDAQPRCSFLRQGRLVPQCLP